MFGEILPIQILLFQRYDFFHRTPPFRKTKTVSAPTHGSKNQPK